MSKLAKRYGDLSPAEKRTLLEEKLQEKASQSVSFYPLSHGQRALWFLYQLAPDSAAYNVMYAARIRTALDIPALRLALQALIDRHATLRTTYGTRSDVLVQQVHQQQDVPFEVIDASSWNPARLDAQLFEEADRPFDLEQEPVLRLQLFTLSEQEHILLLTIHHIAADFWSLDVLMHELSTFYAAEQAGAAASLPPLQVEYTDYVRWQAELLAGLEGEKLRDFWLSSLAGELPTLNLPTDRVRPPIQTFRGASLQYSFELDQELSSRLRALAKAAGTTLYMTALAAFQVLLNRYSGQDDILVGSPALGRSRAEWEQIVGYLINPLVLRADFSENPTFMDFLDQVRRTVLSALEHQEYPFPLLVEQLQPIRDPSRSPLFQVMFVWDRLRQREGQPDAQNPLTAGSNEAGIRVEPMISEQRGAALDLTMTMFEAGDTLSGALQYNVDLFDEETIGRMVEHFQTLLGSIVADPTQRVSHLTLLTDAETHTQHMTWNETTADYPSQACVHGLFEAQVKRTPEAIACIGGEEPFGVAQDGQLTYGELNRRANRLAHYLRASGVGPEALVGICMERSLEMVIGLLGILKAGGAYVPLDPAYPQERLAFMLQDSGAHLLLTQERLLANLPEHEVEVVCLDRDWKQIAPRSARNPARKATAENLAYVIYTSGSTGKPKGVQISHRAVVNLLYAMRDQPGLADQDVLLAVTSVSFDIAALELFLPLMAGARLVVARREVAADGARLSEMLAASGATVMQATPATWRLLLEAGWPGNPRLKILCGGEALPRDLADQLLELGSELWNLYGPTETTIWSAVYPHPPAPSPAHSGEEKLNSRQRPVSIGRPIANTQFYVLDSHLQPLPVGVPGELHIGGDGLARGYLNRPELTEDKFVYVPSPTAGESTASPPDVEGDQGRGNLRLYKTGDLVRCRPDGNLEFLSRIDHQVKVRGYRIELGEIETVLEQHPAVRQVVVVTREVDHIPGEKLLVGYIVSSQAAKPSVSELRRFLRQRLPEYMLPGTFVFLDAMPLTPNRKVDRGALPLPDRARPELEAAFAAPRNPVEQRLADIWAQTLGVDTVGIHDNFFELGGASTQVLQIVTLAAAVGLELKPGLFFVHQTVAELAAVASQGTLATEAEALRAVPEQTVAELPVVTAEAADVPSAPRRAVGNMIIESMGVYLPPKVITTQEVLAGSKNKVSFPLEQLTGIKSRRMAGETEFSIDLAKKAVADCLALSKYSPADIDLLICCNISRCDGPDYHFSFEPNTSVRLKAHFGFEHALVFDLTNACTGMFTAIAIVESYLRTGLIRRGMVVSGEYISHLTQTALSEIKEVLDPRLACLTVGDAGAALILEEASDGAFGFHALDMYTLGKYSSYCIAEVRADDNSRPLMYTDSVRLTAVTLQQSVAHAAHVLKQADWSPEAFQHLIMHQTSKTSLDDAVREINHFFGKQVCGEHNVIYNLAERGNTATTTHFVAVMDNVLKGRIKRGDNVIFGITGSGLTTGTALYTFDDLPERLRKQAEEQTAPQKAQNTPHPAPVRRQKPAVRIESVGTVPEVAQGGHDTFTLAKVASQNCLAGSSYDRNEVDLMLYAGVYRSRFLSEPAIATMVAGDLQINSDIETLDQRTTLAFDIFNGALGFLNACHVAVQMIEAGKASTALIVASEIENNAADFPEHLLGLQETGSALMLSTASDGKTGFGSFVFKDYTDHLDAFAAFTGKKQGKPHMFFERAPDLEERYLACIPETVRALLELEGLELSQIKAIFPPQISSAFISKLSDRLNVAKDKLVDIVQGGKDYYTSSLPYSLQHAHENTLVEPGDIGLIISVGTGIQVGCATYYF